jgi:hypothetical protein
MISFVMLSLLCITAFTTRREDRANKGFAVVELFTSEGCSSCPAADEAVMEIAKQYKEDVLVLGFHVDYWNSLGWKDVFSKSEYSERQKQYASAFSLNSIYTPQIVVNGKIEFVGSDKTKLQQTISKELNNNAARTIELSARETDDRKIVVYVSSANASNNNINIALVQLRAQSNVAIGENEGKVLQHINIVRDLKSFDGNKKDNTISFNLPTGLSKKDFEIVAFSQDKSNLHITDARSGSIQ